MHLIHDPSSPAAAEIDFDRFLAVDIRAGTVIEALPFPKARNPSCILRIDFGPAIGVRTSAARITERHSLADLAGQRVMAVVNLPPRRIGPLDSEALVLGFPDAAGAIALARPASDVPDGARLS